MRRLSLLVTLALAAAALPACQEAGEDQVLTIDATGAVAGLAYLDRDGDGQLDPDFDGPVDQLGVSLVLRGARDTAARAMSSEQGLFSLAGIPVGRYRLEVDTATVADSLRIISIDSADILVTAGDTATVLVQLSYPTVSVAEARALSPGRKVFVEGVALNDFATFGDATVHVRDATGAIRAVRVVPATISVGASIRFLGTTGLRDGQPVLREVLPFFLAAVAPPEPVDVTTLEAATATTAEGVGLDAALVRIQDAAIQDTAFTPAGDFRITVDDGSGAADVVLDLDIPFRLTVDSTFLDHSLDATGVLVPDPTGSAWRIKPRSNSDLIVAPPPQQANSTAVAVRRL